MNARPVTLTATALRSFTPQLFNHNGNPYRANILNVWAEVKRWETVGDSNVVPIFEQAYYENDWFDAIAEDKVRSLAPIFEDTPQADSILAKVEARGYRATDEERAKLRGLITSRRDALAKVTELEVANAALQATTARLAESVTSLRQEQITDGGDFRLTQFWENAAQKAQEEGYCSEYDRMAELLGGIPRNREYRVDISVTFDTSVVVTARNEEEADDLVNAMSHRELAQEITGNTSFEVYYGDVMDVTTGDVNLND